MTRDEARQLLPIIQAYADGKKILLHGRPPIGEEIQFSEHPNNYSIAPEPKMRPWKPEEVPVGAVVRCKSLVFNSMLLLSSGADVEFYGVRGTKSFDDLVEHYEWKWPQEPNDAWRPCGVVE